MTERHEVAEAAVARLFETSDDAAMAAAGAALAEAIRGCASAAELEALVAGGGRHPVVADLFAMGAVDLPLWPEVARALVALAEGLASDAADAARVLGWARWGGGFAALDLVRPQAQARPTGTFRPGFAAAFEAHAPMFRAWLASAAGPRRAAGAVALASCAAATADDLAALVAQAAREDDHEALASELLAAGALARRLGREADAVRAVAARGSIAGGLGATCAAAALALTGTPLGPGEVLSLVGDALGREPLPAAWGWRTPGGVPYRRDALALAVLGWADVMVPELGVQALAAIDTRGRSPDLGALAGAALLRLGLGARGIGGAAAATGQGLRAEDLDAVARAALAPFIAGAVRAPEALRRAGLPADLGGEAGRAFLAGAKLEHRVMDLRVGGRAVSAPFAELWRAVVAGEVGAEDAAEGLVAAVSPDEAVELVTHFQESRMPAYLAIGESPAMWERDQALALAVIARAAARGFDLDAMMRSVAADRRGGLPGHAAIAWLTLRPGPVPVEHRAVVRKGHVEARVPEPVRSLVAALPAGALDG